MLLLKLNYRYNTILFHLLEKKQNLFKCLFYLMPLILFSCKKDYLDIRSDKALIVPSTLNDFQSILDNGSVMNSASPIYVELSGDDFIFTDQAFLSLSETLRDAHIWSTELRFSTPNIDWNSPYIQVYYANLVLEGLNNIPKSASNEQALNNIKGSALFYRANAFYNLAQSFAAQYDPAVAGSTFGIVLKLNADVRNKYSRSTLQETYDQIIADLQEALPLLPSHSIYKTRPSKPAVHGLLARIYLAMGKFDVAFKSADSMLHYYDKLLDYNSLNLTASRPISALNDEVVFHQAMSASVALPPIGGMVDTGLYRSYADNDLRKTAFFTPLTSNTATFKGFYTGGSNGFSGIATDEMFLIRAECYARKGQLNNALDDLNHLLEKRWKAGTFTPISLSNTDSILKRILEERRKELLFRGIRWTDLKRLNKDPRFAISLTRTYNGQVYTLPPNDVRYVLPIPENEIQLSGIPQNER